MDNKINLSQLAERLAQEGVMSKAAAEQFVKNFFDIISQRVLSEGLVKVKGFGTFKLVQMEDRESVNVNTGERFTIEGHQKITFIPDSELKERVNKPFAAFDTVAITEEQADELAKMEATDKQPDKVESPEVKMPEDKVVVHEITQKRWLRFIIRLLIWILCICLIAFMAIYMLWPVIGNRILDAVDRNINKTNKTEIVVDSVQKASPAIEVVPQDQYEPETEIEPEPEPEPEPETETKPVDTPVEEPVQPEVKPVQVPANTASAVKYPTVKLNSQDQAKDLSEFTEADVVNFSMEGDLTTHTLQKGETITRLALKYYGSKKLWPYIVKYNNIKDPAKLQPGARIRIPVLKAK